MILDIDSKIEVSRLSGEIIKSAGGRVPKSFDHGYYTHLVKKEVTRSDGKVQIYWVAPDAGKKLKLRRVHVTSEGAPSEHHDYIKKVHDIDPKDLTSYSWGDKVKIVSGNRHVGEEGIVRSNLSDKTTPEVTVAIPTKATDKDGKTKYKARIFNVNNLQLVHRATDETLDAINAKNIKVKTSSGSIAYVRPEQAGNYELANKTKTGGEAAGKKFDRLSKAIAVDGVYVTNSGKTLRLENVTRSPKNDAGILPPQVLSFSIVNPGPGDKHFAVIEESKFQEYLNAGKVTRMLPEAPTDPAVMPMTHRFESGEFYKDGTLSFDADGEPVVPADKEKDFAEIINENWPTILKATFDVAHRYPMVDKLDQGGIVGDIYEKLLNRLKRYDPYSSNWRGGIPAYLKFNARTFAANECKGITRSKMSIAEDFDGIDPVDDAALKDLDSPGVEDMGGSFHKIDDLRELAESLNREKELLTEKFFGDDGPAVADVVLSFMGLGVATRGYESLADAATALSGKIHGPRSKTPLAFNTLKRWLGEQSKHIRDTLYAEDEARKGGTPLTNLIKRNIELRRKYYRKKGYESQTYTVESVKAPSKSGESKAKWDAAITSSLSKNGVPVAEIPKIKQIVERIAGGRVVPSEFSKVVPKRYVHAVAKTLEDHKIKIFHKNLAKDKVEEVNFEKVINEAARNKQALAASVKKSFGEPIAVIDNYEIYSL